jgi:hypothetical protein
MNRGSKMPEMLKFNRVWPTKFISKSVIEGNR